MLGSTIEIQDTSGFILVPYSFLCFCDIKCCEDMVSKVKSLGRPTDRADIDLIKMWYLSRGDGRLVFVRLPMLEAIDLLTREACEFLGTMILPRSSI